MGGEAAYAGTLQIGDEDLWTFTACAGDYAAIQVVGTLFTPSIRLYGPDGSLLSETKSSSLNTRSASLLYQATNCGTFLMVISSYYLNGTGTYQLSANDLSDRIRLCLPTLSASGLTLTGVRGTANATRFILSTTTNAAAPLTQWTPVLTNTFDAHGVFIYSNTFETFPPQQYYQLTTE